MALLSARKASLFVGPQGPVGPQGIQGPQGNPGTATVPTGTGFVGVIGGVQSAAAVPLASSQTLTLANGSNADLNPTAVSGIAILNISGPTAAFSIKGFIAQADGTILRLVNTTGYNMTISHQAAGETTAARRIRSATGADAVFVPPAGGFDCIDLMYSGSLSRWLLIV